MPEYIDTPVWDKTFPKSGKVDHKAEIRSVVLVIHGEKGYSLQASKAAFAKLQVENKQLLVIPGTSHTDLCDQTDIIPFDDLERFYRTNFE